MTFDINTASPAEIRAEAARRKERRAKGLPLHDEAVSKEVIREKRIGSQHPLDNAIITRGKGELRIVLSGAPRTKKNHTVLGIRQGPAYTKWNADVKRQLIHFTEPLPSKPYNLEAHFYVDRYGVPADLIGLLQGLADSLQAAGVVVNDGLFVSFDGSRKHTDDQKNPRTEISITELR